MPFERIHIRKSLLGFVCGVALFHASSVLAAAPPPAPVPTSIPELDRRLAALFKENGIPGGSVAIIQNGEVTFAKGYGYADVSRKVAATADTPFRAGSISKGVTSVAVMTLVEQKKLALDTPIATLVPEIHFANPWETTDPVRLVHLLEHTTGWPDISTRCLAKDEKSWSTLQGVQFASADFVCRWKPGRFTVYNNAGPAVAGYAIEKVTGQSFDAYTRDAVLRPMGMATADFALTPDLAARISKSYARNGTETPYQYIVLKPAGSLNVSARELAQLARFYLGRGTVDGRRILSPESVDRIERGESNLGARFGFPYAYGLGNAAFWDTGVTFRGHDGSIDSFTSVLGYNVRTRTGYVLLANGGEGIDVATPIAHLVQAFLTNGIAMTPPQTVSVSQNELQRYAGLYRTITPPNDLLRPYTEILGLTRVSAGNGRLVVSGNDFLPTAPHSFRRYDREEASLAFLEDAGSVYKIGAFSAQQKEPLWRIVIIWITGGLVVLGAVIGIVMLIPWIVSAGRGRLAARGGLTMRLLPLAAIVTLAVMFVLPFVAFTGSGTTAVRQLAEPSLYSIAILACSVLYPLLALICLVMAVRRRSAAVFARVYCGATSIALLVVAGYAAGIGWLALRTWTM
jgi:CubicO group peptidase (beta-lactamase class C family)